MNPWIIAAIALFVIVLIFGWSLAVVAGRSDERLEEMRRKEQNEKLL